MRLLAVCLSVLVLLAVFTVATVIDTRDGPIRSSPIRRIPTPNARRPRSRRGSPTRWRARMLRPRARLAAGALAREMRCTTKRPLLSDCRGTVFHAKEDDDVSTFA